MLTILNETVTNALASKMLIFGIILTIGPLMVRMIGSDDANAQSLNQFVSVTLISTFLFSII